MANEADRRQQIDRAYDRLKAEAEAGGYHLNPDMEFTKELVDGLLVNEARYGYPSCPCRLASGEKSRDLDIICPCDYRDADVTEYDACYCGLYVSDGVVRGKAEVKKIRERRPTAGVPAEPAAATGPRALPHPVWRCRVCGYLCARGAPPEVCPVCKARRDRFELFISGGR